MPTITAIRPQKRGKRVNLFLDGRFAFALAKETAQGLEVGKELSPEQVQALTRNDALERARDFSLRLLSYRPRSEKEVRERLGRHGFPPDTVEETIARLKGQGLLDEGAFARFWKEGRETASPRSRRLIEQEQEAHRAGATTEGDRPGAGPGGCPGPGRGGISPPRRREEGQEPQGPGRGDLQGKDAVLSAEARLLLGSGPPHPAEA
ncbi:MAG TPA: RecX family transcriptional regulator [Dehalococcoidia bacterium]|nr:RecX family transcriptional regulator [Dehalococcoidia bacterium]